MAAVVDVGGDGRPSSASKRVTVTRSSTGPPFGSAIGGDALDVPDADRCHRLLAALPARTTASTMPWPMAGSASVGALRSGPLWVCVPTSWSRSRVMPGSLGHPAGDPLLESRQHLQQVGHHERHGRALIALRHQCTRMEWVVDGRSTRGANLEPSMRIPRGGVMSTPCRADLHLRSLRAPRPVPVSIGLRRPPRSTSTASRPSCPLTAGWPPVADRLHDVSVLAQVAHGRGAPGVARGADAARIARRISPAAGSGARHAGHLPFGGRLSHEPDVPPVAVDPQLDRLLGSPSSTSWPAHHAQGAASANRRLTLAVSSASMRWPRVATWPATDATGPPIQRSRSTVWIAWFIRTPPSRSARTAPGGAVIVGLRPVIQALRDER